jgi:hypothetical protein
MNSLLRTRAVLIIWIFLCIFSNEVSAAESAYAASTRKGHEARASGDYVNAVNFFEEAFAECERSGLSDTQRIVALISLADSYYCQKQQAKAREICAKALALCCTAGISTDDPLFQRTKRTYDRIQGKTDIGDGGNGVSKEILVASPVVQASNQIGEPSAAASDTTEAQNTTRKPKRSLYKKMTQAASFWKLKYYFVAQNAKNCDLFYGLVQDNPLTGRASVDFTFPNGCLCRGVAQVTDYPPGGGTKGQRGYIKAKCADGRTINGEFTTASLTTGHGTATDSFGNNYQFTFGHAATEAVKRVNLLRKELGCPECGAKDIEMKVQGLILNKH